MTCTCSYARAPAGVQKPRARHRSARIAAGQGGSRLAPLRQRQVVQPGLRDRRARPTVLESLTELRSATVNTRPHGAELHAERVGDLLIRKALDVTENYGRTVLGRQRHERLVDVAVEMPVIERLSRRGLGAAEASLRLLSQAFEPDPLAPPGHVEEQVRGNPVQPTLKSARNVAVQRAENPDKYLLGQVLCVVTVASQAVGKPVYASRVLPDDGLPGWRRPSRHVVDDGDRSCLVHPVPLRRLTLQRFTPFDAPLPKPPAGRRCSASPVALHP